MAIPAGSLVFPASLQEYEYFMTVRFYSYNIPAAGGTTAKNVLLNQVGQAIHLPLPNTMVDHQDVSYNAEEMGLVAGASLSMMQGNMSAKDGIKSLAILPAREITNVLGQGLNRNPFDLVLQTQGLALNPFMSVAFKAPAFKKHVLRWKLSPSNKEESLVLNTIINAFRYNQLPSMQAGFGGTVLGYPNLVQVKVTTNQTEASNPSNASGTYFTYAFLPAVMESVSVNFAPSGQPSFFGENGAPTEVELTVSLLEIEYWTRNDWEGVPSDFNRYRTVGQTDLGEILSRFGNYAFDYMRKLLPNSADPGVNK